MAYEQRSYSGDAADTTLASGISPTSLSFSVTAGTGSGYPTGGAGPFFVSLDWDTTTKAEKVKVTSRSGDVFTIATLADRGLDGTTAVTHAANATVRHCWTAVDAAEANKAVSETLGAVTTKGDLLAATGLNALARRGTGADNTILVADSTQPTGLSYKTLAALIGLIAGADGTVLTADSAQANGFAFEAAPTAAGNGIYGDGSDGTATLDGTATVAWASKSGSVYTMTNDAYLTTLTVNGGVTLITANYRLFVHGSLTNNGTIHNDGAVGTDGIQNNAVGGTPGGAGRAAGTLAAQSSGGSGAGNGNIAVPGNTGTSTLGGAGGAGHGGAGNSPSSGAPGAAVTAPIHMVRLAHLLVLGRNDDGIQYTSGAGGGGGGDGFDLSGNCYRGGGGGGGGGVLTIAAKTLNNTLGTISAKGGDGGTAAASSPAAGGAGGGGGGGFIILVYNTLTGIGTTNVAGGSGKTNLAGSSSSGATGTVLQVSNA